MSARRSATSGLAAPLALALLACGGDEPAAQKPKGHHGCDATEITAPDGSCIAPGVAVCAPELEPTGDGGCEPLLPATACEKGQTAPVGQPDCQPVAPCGDARYPIEESEPGAEFVDAAYAGADSDGTAARPWETIQDGIDAAVPGATVAIAEGTYAENVTNGGKTVRVVGRCPDLVRVIGQSTQYAAVDVSGGGDGTQVSGLSIEGKGYGVATSGVTGLVLDHLWIHDTADRGLDVDDAAGTTELTLTDSLVEGVTSIGVFVAGATATIDRTVVRDTLPKADMTNGVGMLARPGVTDAPSNLTLRRSVVERNLVWGVSVLGSIGTIEASVVRDNQLEAISPIGGRGISIGNGNGSGDSPPDVLRATVTISGSVIERNIESGIFVRSSDVVVENTVVRDMLANPVDQRYGLGIYAKEQGVVDIRTSLVDRTRVVGVYVRDSQASLISSLVRDTLPNGFDGQIGDGISILSFDDVLAGGHVESTRVTGSARAGLSSFSARVEVQTSIFDCNAVDLDGEKLEGPFQFEFVDGGGNVCPCGEGKKTCEVQSANLAPPVID